MDLLNADQQTATFMAAMHNVAMLSLLMATNNVYQDGYDWVLFDGRVVLPDSIPEPIIRMLQEAWGKESLTLMRCAEKTTGRTTQASSKLIIPDFIKARPKMHIARND